MNHQFQESSGAAAYAPAPPGVSFPLSDDEGELKLMREWEDRQEAALEGVKTLMTAQVKEYGAFRQAKRKQLKDLRDEREDVANAAFLKSLDDQDKLKKAEAELESMKKAATIRTVKDLKRIKLGARVILVPTLAAEGNRVYELSTADINTLALSSRKTMKDSEVVELQ